MKPLVRPARFADIPAILALAKKAHAASRYSAFAGVDDVQSKAVLKTCLNTQTKTAQPFASMTLLAERPDGLEGAIVGVMRALYEGLDVQMATDVFWYVEPGGHGATAARLMKGFHDWALTYEGPVVLRHGVHDAIADPKRTGRFFQSAGFRQAGAIYEKEVIR